MKKVISMFLATLLVFFGINVTAFAAETDSDTNCCVEETSGSSVRGMYSLSGYGHRVAYSGNGSFDVIVTGSAAVGGITFSTECDSDGAYVGVDIKKPDGSYFRNGLFYDGNDEKQFTIWFPSAGTYTIEYSVYTPGYPVHMQCWIYG